MLTEFWSTGWCHQNKEKEAENILSQNVQTGEEWNAIFLIVLDLPQVKISSFGHLTVTQL